MKLGILVNTDKYLEDVIGITKAALSGGHEVIIFTMDDGVKLFESPSYTALCKLQGVSMSFCNLSAERLDIDRDGIPDEIVRGSQYNNAGMVHQADKVIVL